MGVHYGISLASVRVVFFVWWHCSSVKSTTSELALAVEDAAEEQWYADRGNSEIHPSSDLVADGFILFGYTLLILVAPRPRPPLPPEKRYKTIAQDGSITEPQLLPCWQDSLGNPMTDNTKEMEKAELFVSVVVPAFNEEDRLGGMLEEAVNYLERTYGKLAECQQDETLLNEVTKRQRTRRRKLDGGANGSANGSANRSADMPVRGWEILVVSDGSTDGTVETALAFAKDHQLSPHPKSHPGPWSTVVDADGVHTPAGTIRVITLTKNRGKGGAVTHGMRHVRGQYVIFADADGASRFEDLGKLVSACQRIEDVQSRGLAVGSRAHLVGSEAVVKRSKLRNFLMHSFHLILRILTPPATASIKDTQCGFKLFSRASLPYIIPYMHFEGWIFDVEMLMLAEFAGIPVAEVPVGWREVKGSKLNVVWDSLGMAWGLAILRMAWGFGVYRRT
ncbi:dolichyl-phosphate beta-glucosyltransferase [Histoplasma capsulatum H143]|uniref:dolichyl-phosphate beta-glucosyltransferase n=1 Tax=Ajellomyces capsulatus (strain H143) TaxID=544712 RepID=C6HPP4_AJECH|nr:dolichyl-phosphate beta-glucosyltransferase [Histoplasma capsulatum H143]